MSLEIPASIRANAQPCAESYRRATCIADCPRLLDEVYAALTSADDVADAIWLLCCGLRSIRDHASKSEWRAVAGSCRKHPLLGLLHQDPYAARAFQKPRGYPGDAGIIDYLYRTSPSPEERQSLTPIGKRILRATTSTPSGFAVRERKRVAAREIDMIATRKTKPTIMAMAAGHAREIARSSAIASGKVGRFLALDQDQQSLELIRSQYGHLGAEPLPISVNDLLRDRPSFGPVHLAYALGLYDYLPDLVAQRLTSALFDMLAPGGTLLIANFVPDIFEAGYMEAFGDWYLIYRTPQQLEQLSSELPGDVVSGRELWIDDFSSVAYLRITRAHDA
jgi:extracellular factor (EF) 3-hydroxypalmitic acid methyl ester biosynthesis protein